MKRYIAHCVVFAGSVLTGPALAQMDATTHPSFVPCVASAVSPDPSAALTACNDLERLDLPASLSGIVTLTKSHLYARLGRDDEALSEARKAANSGDAVAAYLQIGQLEMDADPQAAIDALDRALTSANVETRQAVAQERHDLLMSAARRLEDEGRFDVSLLYLDALTQDDDATRAGLAFAMRGAVLSKAGDRQAALQDWAKAITLAGNLPQAYAARGLFARSENRLAEALNDLNQAYFRQEADPDFQMPIDLYADLLDQEGKARLQQGDIFGSVQIYQFAAGLPMGIGVNGSVGYFEAEIRDEIESGLSDKANQTIATARSFFRALGDPASQASFEIKLAAINLDIGQAKQAELLIRTADEMLTDLETATLSVQAKKALSATYIDMAKVAGRLDKVADAMKNLERGRGLLKGTPAEASSLEAIADSALQLSGTDADISLATSTYSDAFTLAETSKDRRRIGLKTAKAFVAAGDAAKVDETLRLLVGAFPDFVDAWLLTAEIESAAGNGAAASAAYEKAVSIAATPSEKARALIARANFKVAENEIQSALSDIDTAVSLDAGNVDGWEIKGLLAYQDNRADQALKAFDRVIEIDPHAYDVRLIRARILQDAERHGDAIRDLDVYLTQPDLTDDLRLDAMFLSAISRFLVDDVSGAAKDLAPVVEARAADPLVNLWQGRIAVRAGNADLALTAFDVSFPELPQETVLAYQKILANRGFRIGSLDGVYGPATRSALRACAERQCL